MAHGPISPDGVLSHYPNAAPSGPDLSISFRTTELGDNFVQRIVAGDEQLRLYGRSMLAQAGLDIAQPSNVEPVVDESILYVPITLHAYSETGRKIVEDIGEIHSETDQGKRLKHQDEGIRFGRFVDYRQLVRVEETEAQAAMRSLLVGFDDTINDTSGSVEKRFINQDGSVTVGLSLVEFVINSAIMGPEERFNALRHGRAGLVSFMDSIDHAEDDPLPEFLVGGIVLSPGPYHMNIRSEGNQGKQVPSGSFIDAGRLMGIGEQLPRYERHRQVELTSVVDSGEPQTFSETSITLDLYRNRAPQVGPHRTFIDWPRSSLETRRKLHKTGISALEVVQAADPATQEALLRFASDEDVAGIVLSRHGATIAPAGATAKFNAQNIRTAAQSVGTDRSVPPELNSLAGFVEALENAGDRSRILVANKLNAEYFRGIVDTGDIRAILVRDFGNTALSKEDHSALVDIVESGVSIGWSPEGEAYREMHRSGLWVKPEFQDRIEELDLVIAMYGGVRDVVGDALQPQIDKFFDGLTDTLPVHKLAVAHGSGPGVMRVADETARAKNIMSLGVGISVENIGQVENTRPDGIVRFDTRDRLYRQQMLDTFNTIPIFNAGGYGTSEELAISVCTDKLLSSLPTPKIAIDPDGYYQGAEQMINEVAERTSIQAGDQLLDITEHPFGDAWVPKTFHRVKSYDHALEIIRNFINDPAAYWREAGIPAEKIAIAYHNHLSRLAEVGMNIPTYMKRAAENYIS